MSLLLAGGAPPPTLADDESGWWSGRQLVQAALATSLAAALLTTVAAQTVALDQSETVPAPTVITLDEDFYQPPVFPNSAGVGQLSQWPDDGNQLSPKLDEDYWPLSVSTRTPASPLLQPYTLDSSEIVPQPITFQPDEDGWAPPQPWPQFNFGLSFMLLNLWQDTDLPQFTPIPPSTPLQRHRLGFGYAAGNPSFHF